MFRQDFMFMKYPRNVWKKTESPKYLRIKHFELSVKKPNTLKPLGQAISQIIIPEAEFWSGS